MIIIPAGKGRNIQIDIHDSWALPFAFRWHIPTKIVWVQFFCITLFIDVEFVYGKGDKA
jgi:hypothetical protein